MPDPAHEWSVTASRGLSTSASGAKRIAPGFLGLKGLRAPGFGACGRVWGFPTSSCRRKFAYSVPGAIRLSPLTIYLETGPVAFQYVVVSESGLRASTESRPEAGQRTARAMACCPRARRRGQFIQPIRRAKYPRAGLMKSSSPIRSHENLFTQGATHPHVSRILA